MGNAGGLLSGMAATEMGGAAISEAMRRSGIPANRVDECVMGIALPGGCGQAPARQAATLGGLPDSCCCWEVGKVCASGLKAVSQGYATIAIGSAQVCVVGGMESMSNVPDFLLGDGLIDSRSGAHMGEHAERCAAAFGIGREAQDRAADASYCAARRAWKEGLFDKEVIAVNISRGKREVGMDESTSLSVDEAPSRFDPCKMRKLPPRWPDRATGEGTVTAASASPLSDGAAALVLASREIVDELGLNVLAEIIGCADASLAPENFILAPSAAARRALSRAGLDVAAVNLWEINEAFSVARLLNETALGLVEGEAMVNPHGGAVALGHPLGCSGARIAVTLIHAMATYTKNVGCATICNGGGGGTAIVFRRPTTNPVPHVDFN